ncbi:hypothetical protein [Nocardioides sp. Root151]|uniref:hypothetical protein n=1 Tax=Nocardioides sp. Root151 TaxID=1736475 RepID=UPI0007035698|nr:hypothetical protein [Nocardioides sp. Root151]KQZ67529.1 hypothetical protein ASD66_21635 [Nocardioides sp. Root151]
MNLEPHHDDWADHDEHAVRDVLHSSMNDVSAPLGVEVGARRLGRRMRTRRRLGGIAAGGVAAAALAIGVPMVIGGGNDVDERPDNSAVATEPSSSPSEDGTQRDPDAPAWWSMPAGEMAETLADLLPAGVTLSDPVTTNTDRAPGEPLAEMEGYLVATLTTEDGPGKVNLVLTGDQSESASSTEGEDGGSVPSTLNESDEVESPEGEPDEVESPEGEPEEVSGPAGTSHYDCSPESDTDPKHCTVIRDGDGRVIGRILDTTADGVRDLSITLVAPDNGTVMINVANTLSEKWPYGATPTAPDVALTLAQLRTIAENPVWTSYRP